MQDYDKLSISEAVDMINDKIFLPDIQRDFVWKPYQAYALFDSIMRDYPISTLLFWKIDGKDLISNSIKKFEFVKTDKQTNQENKEINSEKEYYLVLDGQQRLTTFNLVIKGTHIIRNNPYDLYFNVLSGKEEDDDGNLYEFKLWNEKKGNLFDERDSNNNIKKIWYRVKSIYDINELEDVQYINIPEIEKIFEISLTIDQKKALSRLTRLIKYEKIIYFYPEVENDYDKVLDIFVRTNRGGTILTYSDLLFSTIKLMWEDARHEFELFLKKLNQNDKYSFSRDFLLKTLLVIYAKDSDSVRYKTKNFTNDMILLIKGDDKNGEWYKRIVPSISLIVDLIRDRLLLTHGKLLSSYNALIPLIYWVYIKRLKGFGNENNCISDAELANMKVWLIKALLGGTFSGQSDSTLYNCKAAIDYTKSNIFPAKEIESRIKDNTRRSMDVEWEEVLEKSSYNSWNSYLILSIIYRNSINFSPIMSGNYPEQDHIYSQDELRTAGIEEEQINNIFNIRYLESAANKIKSNTELNEWIKNAPDSELKRHKIPRGNWTIDNFKLFLAERKVAFLDNIEYLTYGS